MPTDIDLTSLYTTIGWVLGTPADSDCNHFVATVYPTPVLDGPAPAADS